LAAGIAALVLSIAPELNRDELRNVLANASDKIGQGYGSNGRSPNFGHGSVSAARSVDGVG
jgi:hypothetical protein